MIEEGGAGAEAERGKLFQVYFLQVYQNVMSLLRFEQDTSNQVLSNFSPRAVGL